MGMAMELWRVTPDELEQIKKDPEAVDNMIETMEPESEEWQNRLGDLDKSWNLIHYLLTGTVYGGEWPASALLSGTPIHEPAEFGDIAPTVLSAAEVAEFATHLETRDDSSLRERFDLKAMAAAGVYLADPDDPNPKELMDYAFAYTEDLRKFMRAAAAAGDAVIITLG